jgi:hypothetical protein
VRSATKESLSATGLFILLTILMTWPQAKGLGTHAYPHYDVYFNMWRLGWIAHALVASPNHLFDGNIFYPEPRSLTFSDAVLVEGLVAAPLLILGVPRVLVHNLLLLGAIVSSATGTFVLTRHLTRSTAAGIVAGIVFAFAPYRFDHYMHLELQWTTWMPWTFWALHRTLETGTWRNALLTGVFLSLQMLSSIYYGVFLGLLVGVVSVLLLVTPPRDRWRRSLARLTVAAAITAGLCGAYALPYLATKQSVGGRGESEIIMFSARASNYLVATPDNVVYGRNFAGRSRPERRLFPGTLVAVLAIVGLLLRPPGAVALIYLIAMLLSFEMSLGLSGYSYRLLYDHVPIFHGFRAVARLGIFVTFFLAVLGAFGYATIAEGRNPRVRRLLLAATVVVLLLEYRVHPLPIVRYPNASAPLYSWLARQPPGVVAELPLVEGRTEWEARVSYMSTFHWKPLVNGYSGFVPQSYVDRMNALRDFPDDRSLSRLQRDNVRYAVVHIAAFGDRAGEVLETLAGRYRLKELGRFLDADGGEAVVFGMR